MNVAVIVIAVAIAIAVAITKNTKGGIRVLEVDLGRPESDNLDLQIVWSEELLVDEPQRQDGGQCAAQRVPGEHESGERAVLGNHLVDGLDQVWFLLVCSRDKTRQLRQTDRGNQTMEAEETRQWRQVTGVGTN